MKGEFHIESGTLLEYLKVLKLEIKCGIYSSKLLRYLVNFAAADFYAQSGPIF